MAYSRSLVDRIRRIVKTRRGVEEKKMFGGVCFLLSGHIQVGVWEQSLIARVGPEQAAKTLRQPCVTQFEISGRPMKGWVVVEPDGVDTDQQLCDWIERAEKFVETLPAK
jgi:hypothetical protein